MIPGQLIAPGQLTDPGVNFASVHGSSIEHGGIRTFFHMVDQYFGNDSLEPFESNFISSTGSR